MASRSSSAASVSSYSRVGLAIGFPVSLLENIAYCPSADFSCVSSSDAVIQKGLQLSECLFLVLVTGIERALEEVIFKRNTFQGSKGFQALVLFFRDINRNAAHIIAHLSSILSIVPSNPQKHKNDKMWVVSME